ncbi:MAG: hypothetical protein NC401_15085 [Ruminococcus sp.]|nr:hypothetical protein [Ruminococcus sp.]
MVGRSNNNANANGGLAYANANNDSANANSNNAARLANSQCNTSKYNRINGIPIREIG